MNWDPDSEIEKLEAVSAQYGQDMMSRTEKLANDFMALRAMEQVRGPDILVLGAATGAWAEPLLERFGGFDTVDAVKGVVEQLLGRHGAKVRGYVSFFELFTPEKQYDTVIMGHVLEHLHDPVAVLNRARVWLKPGGRVLILVPNAASIHRSVGVLMGLLPLETSLGQADLALGHRRVYTWSSLRSHVEEAGLACTLMSGLVLKPLSNAQMDSWSEPLLTAFFELGERLPEVACAILCVAKPRCQGHGEEDEEVHVP